MSGRFAPSKGDWVCSDSRCGNLNFARRDKCNKCGRPKKHNQGGHNSGKEIGKEFAEKSRGLFGPDDWQCKSCGNVNWARRTVCNVCNAAKVNTQGQRTGYGGGYMERDEVVDYKRHDESDDEYDEFGLKKKKYRKTHGNGDEAGSEKVTNAESEELMVNENNQEKNMGSENQERKEEEEEEEEEESGDDEDLAKYDIWGDDEGGNNNDQKSPTAKNGIKEDLKENDEEGVRGEKARASSRSSSEGSSSSSDSSSSSSDDESSSSSSSTSSTSNSPSTHEEEKQA